MEYLNITISKFVLKKYWNLNIFNFKICIKNRTLEILCLSYEYQFSIINFILKYIVYLCPCHWKLVIYYIK